MRGDSEMGWRVWDNSWRGMGWCGGDSVCARDGMEGEGLSFLERDGRVRRFLARDGWVG